MIFHGSPQNPGEAVPNPPRPQGARHHTLVSRSLIIFNVPLWTPTPVNGLRKLFVRLPALRGT